MPDECLDAVVVGAGQAGLGVSYFLAQAGVRHRVLERGRIGESWRSQRWDTFRMNTINAQTVMPGCRYAGPDPEGFMTQHGWIGLLEDFAARHTLPVETNTPVDKLAAAEQSPGTYRVITSRGALLTRNVVIASGAHIRPRVPAAAKDLPSPLHQLHSADYRNAAAVSLQALSAQGVILLGRFMGSDGAELRFADDLRENIRFADAGSTDMKRQIDAYIPRVGLDAPPAEPDPAETVPPRCPEPPILRLDSAREVIATVLWCTGLVGDLDWVRLPICDDKGQAVHARGITAAPGIYVTGLP